MTGMQKQWPNMAWETTRIIWEKSTERPWPDISIGLIRRAAVITFENDYSKDSERLRIVISMTLWARWKSRNKNTINDQDVAPGEASSTLKEHIRDLMRNATRFLEGIRRMIRERALRTLWADGYLIDYDPKTGPAINRLEWDAAGLCKFYYSVFFFASVDI